MDPVKLREDHEETKKNSHQNPKEKTCGHCVKVVKQNESTQGISRTSIEETTFDTCPKPQRCDALEF